MNILDLSELDQKKIYAAIKLIESALDKYGENYFNTYLNDKKSNSIIHLSYSNTKQKECHNENK